jgi:hypothetical protein
LDSESGGGVFSARVDERAYAPCLLVCAVHGVVKAKGRRTTGGVFLSAQRGGGWIGRGWRLCDRGTSSPTRRGCLSPAENSVLRRVVSRCSHSYGGGRYYHDSRPVRASMLLGTSRVHPPVVTRRIFFSFGFWIACAKPKTGFPFWEVGVWLLPFAIALCFRCRGFSRGAKAGCVSIRRRGRLGWMESHETHSTRDFLPCRGSG